MDPLSNAAKEQRSHHVFIGKEV